jgi:DNA-binding MarR family transcriptional regulator
MPHLLLKDLPRYDCLLEMARQFPDLDPSAAEAYLNLLRAADEVFRISESNMARHGMSPGRFTVLMLLVDKAKGCPIETPQSPASLADRAEVTRATMTGLIDTLEKDGLVRREPAPEDRRMMIVRITPAGHAALMAVLPSHFQRMAELMSPLSEGERKTLVSLLTKVATQAATIATGSRKLVSCPNAEAAAASTQSGASVS